MAVLASVLAPASGPRGPDELLVPAYFYPTAGGDWGRLEAAAKQVTLTAILNPASGPGQLADPNYVKATTNLRAAGGSIVAYISTSYGERSLADVKAEIARYTRFYKVEGFFIDEMNNNLSDVELLRGDLLHIKSLDPRYRVIGNPGTGTPEAYLTTPTADTLVTLEGPEASYANARPSPYADRYRPGRFANIVHGVPTPAAMLRDLALAAGRNIGVVYLTDNAHPGNPYSRLPTYFEQEVAAVKAAAAVTRAAGAGRPPRPGDRPPRRSAVGRDRPRGDRLAQVLVDGPGPRELRDRRQGEDRQPERHPGDDGRLPERRGGIPPAEEEDRHEIIGHPGQRLRRGQGAEDRPRSPPG